MDVEYELSSKRVERSVLRAELDEDELWESDEFQRLEQRIAELETQVDTEDDEGDHAERSTEWNALS